jgi:hypothetical protein
MIVNPTELKERSGAFTNNIRREYMKEKVVFPILALVMAVTLTSIPAIA